MVVNGGKLTIAAVKAMLSREEVKAAVHGDANDSSTGFGIGGMVWELGKGAPNGGGNIVPGPEVEKGI